jgi:hypothetical protein
MKQSLMQKPSGHHKMAPLRSAKGVNCFMKFTPEQIGTRQCQTTQYTFPATPSAMGHTKQYPNADTYMNQKKATLERKKDNYFHQQTKDMEQSRNS